MRRWIGRLLALVVVIVLIPSVVILLAFPAKWEHSRNIIVNAKSDTIHEWVRDMKFWEQWHPFADQYPGAEIATYGSTRKLGDGISILRPITDAFIANPKDPVALAAETKARDEWRKSQDDRRTEISGMRNESTKILDTAFDRRKLAMAASSESRNRAEALLREAPIEEHSQLLTKAISVLKANGATAEWAHRRSDEAIEAVGSKDKAKLASAVRDLYDQIKREDDPAEWTRGLAKDIEVLREEVGNWRFIDQINELADDDSELKKVRITMALVNQLESAASSAKYGAIMKESAGLLRVAAKDMEKAQGEIAELRSKAKALEVKADALDELRRKDWFAREIGSVILLTAQKKQVSPAAQKLLVALEAANRDELSRSQYLSAISAAGISEKDADATREVLRDASMVNVVPRPDRIVVHTSATLANPTVDDISLLVQLGQVWKEVFKDNWLNLAKDKLTPAEAEEGLRLLLDAGVISFNKSNSLYTFLNLRDLDERIAPMISPAAIKALLVLLSVDTKSLPYTKYSEIVAPALGRERMAAALKKLTDAGVLSIEVGAKEEMTVLTRKEGTGFRFVFGKNSRMTSQFQITYRGAEDGTTVVTWRGSGEYKSNPVHRVVGAMSNGSVAEFMDRGLGNLKKLAETGPPPEDE